MKCYGRFRLLGGDDQGFPFIIAVFIYFTQKDMQQKDVGSFLKPVAASCLAYRNIEREPFYHRWVFALILKSWGSSKQIPNICKTCSALHFIKLAFGTCFGVQLAYLLVFADGLKIIYSIINFVYPLYPNLGSY